MIRLHRCLHCRKAFRANATGRPALGCSVACKKAAQKVRQAANKRTYRAKERQAGKRKPFQRRRAQFQQCAWCYQLFTIKTYKKQDYCNRQCYGKARRWQRAEIPVAIKEKVLQMLEAA